MRRWIAVIAVIVGALVAGPVHAQGESAAALRQELEGVRRELMTLRAELDALRAEHETALSTIERMRLAMARGSGGGSDPGVGDRSQRPGASLDGPGASEEPGVGRSVAFDPYSSPGALFVAASVSYSENIWDSAPDDAGRGWVPEPGAVREWTAAARREIRGRSEWLTRVRLVEMDEDAETQRAMVTILDRRTLEPVEGAFAVDVPDRFAGRIGDALAGKAGETAGGGSAVLFELLVEAGAAPVFQPGRAERGPFDYPRFIGPFAGFGFDVVIRGVGVLTETEAKAAALETPKEEGRR